MGELKYFFSYARKDSQFVLKLAKDLRAAGADLWLDQMDILGGQRWDRAVEEALKYCKGMIVVLSPEALASHNVMDEVSYALEEGKLLVPVLLHHCDIPFRLRRVQYVDFTTNHDIAFPRLLRALDIEMPSATTGPSVPQKLVAQRLKDSVVETSMAAGKHPKEQITQQNVVVVGDTTASEVAAQLRNRKVCVTEDWNSISSTTPCVIAHDYKDGITPVHREIVRKISLNRNGAPKLLWMFTNVRLDDDKDLIEIVELEVRELLAIHNIDSDKTPFAVDIESVPVDWNWNTKLLKGWEAIMRLIVENWEVNFR